MVHVVGKAIKGKIKKNRKSHKVNDKPKYNGYETELKIICLLFKGEHLKIQLQGKKQTPYT